MSQKNRESIDGTSHKVMEKPTTDKFCPPWYVNVGDAVPDQEVGVCCAFNEDAGLVLYEDDGTPPAWDEQIGPKPGSWKLHKGYPGFHVEGDVEGDAILARQEVPHIILAMSGTGGVPARISESSFGKAKVHIIRQTGDNYFSTEFLVDAYNASRTAVKGNKFLHLVRVMGRLIHVNFEDCTPGS